MLTPAFLLPLIIGAIGLIIIVSIGIWMFQLRTATQQMADRLEDIYRLLSEQNKS